jgi:hypothetical protein
MARSDRYHCLVQRFALSGTSCLPFASDGWLTLTTKLARSAIDLAA